jgi:hypothetical protein
MLAFRQIPENDLGVIRILDADRLSGHVPSLRPTSDARPTCLSGTRGNRRPRQAGRQPSPASIGPAEIRPAVLERRMELPDGPNSSVIGGK